ncbi:MAG: hypothetical protein WBV68_08260 [Exiguobacterium oxidotolerans]|jgi:hypothetical protein
MPSEFTRIRLRTAIKCHVADCGHKINPGERYIYSVGRMASGQKKIDTLKMCLKCFGTPEQWWKSFGITDTCKPSFMIDLWNNRVKVGDVVYVFIGNKVYPTFTHTPAILLKEKAVVGVTITKKPKKSSKSVEVIAGPISLFQVVPE